MTELNLSQRLQALNARVEDAGTLVLDPPCEDNGHQWAAVLVDLANGEPLTCHGHGSNPTEAVLNLLCECGA